jgi:hypothetical protein
MKKPTSFWIALSNWLTRLTPPMSTRMSPARMDNAPTVPVA